MNYSVQVHGRLVDLQELGIVQVVRVWTVAAHDHRHRLLEVLHFLAQSVQVKVVCDVFLVDLGEELVPLQVTEPLDPSVATITVVFVVHSAFSLSGFVLSVNDFAAHL